MLQQSNQIDDQLKVHFICTIGSPIKYAVIVKHFHKSNVISQPRVQHIYQANMV